MAETQGKKRKRESNVTASPNKRPAFPSTTIRVKHSKGSCPVVVSSKSIAVPDVQFKAFTKATNEDSENAQPGEIILHSSEHPRLDYTALPKQELAHYIAVLDESNVLTITPAYSTQLQAVLRTEAPEESPKKTFAQQRLELGQAFGTKKAKKALASRTINAITNGTDDKADEVQAAILEAAAENVVEVDEADELQRRLAAKPIPMPNVSAGTVEEVYAIDTLIRPQDLRLIDVKEWRRMARADENIKVYHRFPAFRVATIGKEENTTKLKVLSYIALLLRFNEVLKPAGKTSKKVPKKEILAEKLDGYSEQLIDGVRRRFSSDATPNELTKWHIEKLHTTICALSLYVDDWQTNTSDLRDDLRVENKIISQYFAELGCKIRAMTDSEREKAGKTKAEATMTRIATLKLPLDFPKLRSGRRK